MDKLREQFLQPSDEYSPIPFWFWNDLLTEAEITRQIRDFHAKGVMGFVIHPRIGIPDDIEYLSDRFMELVQCAVNEAKALKMKVILYDEGMYPSGSAHGMVVKHNPKFASRGLKMNEYPVESVIEFEPELEDADDQIVSIQAVKKLDDENIDPASTLKLELEQGKVKFTAPDSDQWSVLVFVETYSRGTIRGVHFGEDDGEPNAPAATDLLNPEAIQAFIKFTHQRYYDVLKADFGETIIGMFTDEPAILGRRGRRGLRPWTNNFLAWYLAHNCNELDLPALWFKAGPDTDAKRKLFKQAVNKKLEEAYYAPISRWCAEHNIALTGHPEDSDDIGVLKYFQIPGQDVVWRWVAPEDELAITGKHSTMAKCSSDSARHSGARRNSNECFACSGANKIEWAFNMADMKWYMDWLFVRGVNLLYPHAFYYSIDGEGRYNERPPDVGPHNIWWPHYRTISDYIKRMSWLMTDSVNQAPVAILCEADFLPWEIARPLYENQIEFNYLENDLLESAVKVVKDQLVIADQKYRVLVIEAISHLTPESTKVVEEFIANGGAVVVYDQNTTDQNLAGTRVINEVGQVVAEVDRVCKRDFVMNQTSADLRSTHVVKDGLDFYLFVNEGDSEIKRQVTINQTGYAEVWEAWTGSVELLQANEAQADSLTFELDLGVRDSLIVAIDSTKNYQPVTAKYVEKLISETTDFSQGWQVSDAPQPIDVSEKLKSWTEFPELETFSGTLTYTNKLVVNDLASVKHAELDLGEVGELPELSVNGKQLPVKLLAPFKYDVSEYLTDGENLIEVKVANTLANKFAHAKLTSGLIGPVKITLSR